MTRSPRRRIGSRTRHIARSIADRPAPSFLTRHKRLVSIIGTMIVFSTFVVKDAIRDHVKDTVDSLDSAESVYAVRNDSQNIFEELDGISQHTDQVWDTTPARAKYLRDTPKADLSSDSGEQATVDLQIKTELENVSRLVDKMPQQKKSLATERDKLLKRFAAIKSEEDTFHKMLSDPRASYDDTFDIDSQIGSGSEDLDADISDFSDRVLAEFGAIRAREEKNLTIATWTSYVLYSVGTILTFAGKIFGIDDLVATD